MSLADRARPVLEAAAQWKERCLVQGGSILTDQSLWNSANFAALDRHFVQNLDAGEGDFLQKLEAQLAPAPPDAKKLAAELLWVVYLIEAKSAMGGEKKRSHIKKVWEWSGESLDAPEWAFGSVLDDGVSHPGMAYHNLKWKELCFFIDAMNEWFSRDGAGRAALLADPWSFAEWLESRPSAKGRQLRHVLLYLLFPSHFERIVTTSHKRDIVEAFSKKWGDPVDADEYSLIAVDKAVLAVRERLEEEYGEKPVDFYASPHREVWKLKPTPKPVGGDDDEKFLKRFDDVGAWIVGAGAGGHLWDRFREEGVAAVGFFDLGDLSEFDSEDAIYRELVEKHGQKDPRPSARALWRISHEVRLNDIVVAKQGWSKLLGYGTVTGPYRYDPDQPEAPHTVRVEWTKNGPYELPEEEKRLHGRLIDARESRGRVARWVSLLDGEIVDEVDPVPSPLEDVFLTPQQFNDIIDAFGRRKNLILQGPPGVGKTFIAHLVAWSLIGARRPDQVQLVQFHQSYSYEDFVQGYRPTESGGFEVKDGIFREFCARAAARPEDRFVFIIDEINRGNLSRVFGELLMLLEADKRNERFRLRLPYSRDGETFFVPPNVYVLGLMNTADRSLAMVDYALRRRFAFVSLKPAFGTEPFRDCLTEAGASEALIDLIDARMEDLNRKIREDTELGPGFEIGHSYFVPSSEDSEPDQAWYLEVINTQIGPLLHEYWADDPDAVRAILEGLRA